MCVVAHENNNEKRVSNKTHLNTEEKREKRRKSPHREGLLCRHHLASILTLNADCKAIDVVSEPRLLCKSEHYTSREEMFTSQPHPAW